MYLDNAATTPLSENVKKTIYSLVDNFYNPSSVYQNGLNSRNIIEMARENVAEFIHSSTKDNIIFCSSGSAANTLGIRGIMDLEINHNCFQIAYSPTLHKSILLCVKEYNADSLQVNQFGLLDIRYIEDICIKSQQNKIKPFIIFEYANSEIGTIQHVKSIIDIVHKYNGICMIDCTGSIPYIPLNVKELDADIITFSGHKLMALKGVAVLYKKKEITLHPLVFGNQEQGLFGGTENILGIASLGTAVSEWNYNDITTNNRNILLNMILKNIPNTYLIGELENRLPYNIYICFQGIDGSKLMTLLDSHGIQVSTGSACTSGDNVPSPTLKAIGVPQSLLNSGIRITLAGTETYKELEYVCNTISNYVKILRITGDNNDSK